MGHAFGRSPEKAIGHADYQSIDEAIEKQLMKLLKHRRNSWRAVDLAFGRSPEKAVGEAD